MGTKLKTAIAERFGIETAEALPPPPKGHVWQWTTSGGDTFNFQLVSDDGVLVGSARIAVDLYGRAGVHERAVAISRRVSS